ncbi:MAG TPA: glycosyltransferase family 1 protein [Bacteroidales bacterium]|nr:glycosyltransferase family 1 protein [Bacteroidales bacterium]
MRIGFDAKRAFFNKSGLGTYSRETISILSDFFPTNEYILYSPRPSKGKIFEKTDNLTVSYPQTFYYRTFSHLWRAYGLSGQLVKEKIDLYHGLSNELPMNIHQYPVKTVVTIHDLIFLRYPKLYGYYDRKNYEKKFRYAAQSANRVIAVSRQTANDLFEFFSIDEKKVDVVYQGCNPQFWQIVSEADKQGTASKYLIPEKFILSVGTIEKRKNILAVIKAMHQHKIFYPLVVVGRPTDYLDEIRNYIEEHNLNNIYFLHDVPIDDLPAFYQMAELFIYPSLFEGFGIPIVEALCSKVPVITSKGGCFAEAGGKSSIYIDPYNIDEIGEAIKSVLNNNALRISMISEGYNHVQQFRLENIAGNIMRTYEKIL